MMKNAIVYAAWRSVLVALCALIFTCVPVTAEFRTLVNKEGKKIRTELISKQDGKVTFRLRSGARKTYTVDISSLSKADQEFLQDWQPDGGGEVGGDDAGDDDSGADDVDDGVSDGPKSLYPKTKQEIRSTVREILKTKDRSGEFREEQKATNMLNVYRYLCGVPHKVKMDSKLNGHCEEAAMACLKKGGLSHDLGHYTNKCNLSSMGDVEASVAQYINDAGANNRERRGHRRWCLNPPMDKTGFGSGGSQYSAMWAMDGAGDGSRVKTWSYPGAGYFPKEYMHGTAWSFYMKGKVPPKDKIEISIFKLRKSPEKKISSNAEVEGRDIGVKYVFAYGNTINFEPKDFEAGDRGVYWVRITGGGLREGYVVEFF
ncbi:CAP domain-containing protein [Verrucomicrobiaceae bacterium N1E253]|uniref:CAP domain-containing protein n=1 Tax=Oceaniferula marina TaxID=2748318 RepID=A0A851GJQ3_9BACT|nr:CAP domain-containing protein [Oceaniferula marina]NWK55327.1 CAP domain-containing protein [Oceaniferula marina]